VHPEEFIKLVGPDAMKLQEETGVPAAVVVAQAALETGWGKTMVEAGHNLFGIKWTGRGPYVEVVTHEEDDRGRHKVTARFRAYGSWHESLLDHNRLLRKGSAYKLTRKVLHNPEAVACALQIDGYATDRQYAAKLIAVMHGRRLIERFPPPPRK